MLKLLTFLICMTITIPALASESQIITYEGQTGFFFPEEIGTLMLKDLEEFKIQKHRVSLLEEKLILTADKIALLNTEIQIVDEISQKYKENYVNEHQLRISDQKHYEAIIKKKDAWYRHPTLWFGVGFVVAAAAAIGLTFGLQEARE